MSGRTVKQHFGHAKSGRTTVVAGTSPAIRTGKAAAASMKKMANANIAGVKKATKKR